MSPPPKSKETNYAFFLVKTQFENVGDALINGALIGELSSYAVTEVDVTFCPSHFVMNLDISSLPPGKIKLTRFVFPMLFNLVRRRLEGCRVYFVLPPGGNAGEKSIKGYLFNSAYNRFLSLLSIFGVQIVCVGVSYDAIGPRYARVVRERARLTAHHYIRDRLSAISLATLNAPYTGLTSDFAFRLPFNLARLRAPADHKHGAIAFSFRTDKGYVDRGKIQQLVEAVQSANPSRKLVFISQVQRDSAFMRSLHDGCKARAIGKSEFIETFQDLRRTIDVYASCDYILSNRLHALLLGFSAGAVPIAVITNGQDNKVRGIFEDAKLVQNVYSLDDDKFENKWFDDSMVNESTIEWVLNQKSTISAAFNNIFRQDLSL